MSNHPVLPLIASMFLLLSAGCTFGRQAPAPAAAAKPKDMGFYNQPLAPGESGLVAGDIATLPDLTLDDLQRQEMLSGIHYSLDFLARPSADKYYPVGGVTKAQVVTSLQALAKLLQEQHDSASFNHELKTRFRVMMSVGCDRRGTVLFTGYYTPIFNASLEPTSEFRYPVYRKPQDLFAGPSTDAPSVQHLPNGSARPYPSRSELLASGALKGLELVYFRDPYEAYVVEVQGSAKVRLTNGELVDIGFNGTNGLRYHAIAQDLVSEGKIRAADLSLATVRAYFASHPQELPPYIARNPRMIFLTRTHGGPYGSLNQPVTVDVTVATDKSIFPPGGACLVLNGVTPGQPASVGTSLSLHLDQDTGGAIRAAGRCDLYMGTGDNAERRAGNQFAEGQLYYLLLR